MATYDTVITGGTVANACATFKADVGIKDGQIAALGLGLGDAQHVIDARGKYVLPGGIETHCHIAQESSMGMMTADDYFTGSVSAAFGGNTTIVPFAAQQRGQTIPEVLQTYDDRAAPKSVLDYSYHLIVTDPTEVALKKDLPAAFARGITSFKVFMTYDKMIVSDEKFLDILVMARENGGLTMVHAENNAMIKWMVGRLLERGYDAPKYHAVSHPAAAEVEAVRRGIALASFVEAPLLFVHISTDAGARAIAEARMDGRMIFGETCPQYMFLTADDLDRPGVEGAKFCCSPPLRDVQTQTDMWRHLNAGSLQLYSSDHAPYRFDKSGKLSTGDTPPFKTIANGLPGIELRAPLLFSEGVQTGRITLEQFVALTASNAARLFGMGHRKGAIAIGYDADIAIWDPEKTTQVTAAGMHDNMDYTPFEGWELNGWPVTVINQGRIIVDGGELKAKAGDGSFIPRKPFDPTGFLPPRAPEMAQATNFGAKLF
ncbi:dihydropyrimidinase [Litoreibacter ponti]|uniref:D-hydantoinase n=1 Tax=Litoreibacter ponti TaxID=1510457 RepID=A0A2T6BHB2_9RHOB|nr:dihydropyrimidinase [Litoreibacter ponti]PTX55451.1 dihydropyrimidinase [Litoreibacter ponti]